MARPMAMATRGKQEHTERDLAYLAGMVDADGCISISRNAPSTIRNNVIVNPRYVLHLHVVNTDRKLMDWLVAKFGGSYNARTPREPKQHRVMFNWRFDNGKALPLLRLLEPYLIVKQDRARLGIEFIEGWETLQNGPGSITPPHEVARREHCYQQMKAMNQVGPVQPQRLSPLAPAMQGDAIV